MTNKANSGSNNNHELVLVTGASGFIAKNTIDRLLRAGYRVRGTVRNEECTGNVLRGDNDTFSLVTVDLLSEQGWKEAVQGCHYVLHIASPYPLKPPKHREDLVPVARDGSLRVVRVALEESTVKRIVVTSSGLAMLYDPNEFSKHSVRKIREDSWTDPNWNKVTAYPLSKTVAERAVWDYVEEQGAKDKVVVVNPMMVLGPMYDNVLSTSSEMCRLLMSGAYPAVPNISHAVVDVRDVAHLLERAMVVPNVAGRRLLAASSGTVSLIEMGRILGEAFPDHKGKIPKYALPDWLCRIAALFDKSLQMSLVDLGMRYEMDARYTTELTGVTFRPAKEAIQAMGQSLIEQGFV